LKKIPNLSQQRIDRERESMMVKYYIWRESRIRGGRYDYTPLPKCECAYCSTMNQPELRLDRDCEGCSAPLAA
jgi:hypothetical protein